MGLQLCSTFCKHFFHRIAGNGDDWLAGSLFNQIHCCVWVPNSHESVGNRVGLGAEATNPLAEFRDFPVVVPTAKNPVQAPVNVGFLVARIARVKAVGTKVGYHIAWRREEYDGRLGTRNGQAVLQLRYCFQYGQHLVEGFAGDLEDRRAGVGETQNFVGLSAPLMSDLLRAWPQRNGSGA